MKYLIGADIGTTSLKAALFDEQGNMLNSVTKDYTLTVSGDRVEFPAEDYFRLFSEAYEELSAGYEIAAVAVDTQGETMILTDEEGTVLRPAIVWLDNRAVKEAEAIKAKFGNQRVYEVTGQPEIAATWPAAKLMWVKNNEPDIFAKTKKVFLLEDYILYRMTGNFVAEETLLSSTIYFDITKKIWWDEMLDFIGVDPEILPAIKRSATPVGTYKGAAVVTGAIDQIAGAIGAGVIGNGIISEMTGTTMAIFAPTDRIPPFDPASIIPCHVNFDGNYCLLAWTPTAGIALKWFKNNLCEQYSFRDLDELAEKIAPGSDGLTFLPFLCGSTMPKYNPEARGAFLGLTMEHTRAHMVRAVLEAVACLLKENLDYMKADCAEIRSMGGGASSPLWCQMKADMTGKRIVTLQNNETACLGSAFLAGLGAGIYRDIAECAQMVAVKKTYTPGSADYTACYQNFIKSEEKIL